jgi:GntR family transcriptional regulator
MLSLRISASSGVPVYLQLEQQIKHAVAAGVLRAGDGLPSTRRAAAELRINPNTVARAFQNLEREGVLRTVPGGGTFVADVSAMGPGLLKAEKLRRLRPLAQQLAVEATQLRVAAEDVHRLVDAALLEYPAAAEMGEAEMGAEAETQIPCGNDNQERQRQGQGQEQTQIPYGNDKQEGMKTEDQGGER